jgi:hypothetical protein
MESVELTGSGPMSETPLPSADAAEAAACRATAHLQSLQQTPQDIAVWALADKIEASLSVSVMSVHFPLDFRGTIVDFVKKYHADVLRLGAVATHLAKLCQHQVNGMYPTSLHSIRVPKIQWTHEFLAVPQSSQSNFSGDATTCSFMGFSEAISIDITNVKDNILGAWIAEKKKELALFQTTATTDTGVSNLRSTLEERMGDLRSRFTYDSADGRPIPNPIPNNIQEIIAGQLFQHEVLYSVTPTIIGKINSIVHNAEDRRLSNALKCMELLTEAPRTSSETQKNDVDALAKKVTELTKKLGGRKKVSDTLLPLILCSTSILSITRHDLSNLCTSFLDAKVQEADEGEEEWQEADHLRQVPLQEEGEGFGFCEEEEVPTSKKEGWQKGFWEEEWQEIGLACDKYDLWTSYSCNISLDDSKLCTSCSTCSFLLLFYPLVLITNLGLHDSIQLCSFLYQVHVLPSHWKINIFDYTTYPLIATYMPCEISLIMLSFSAPEWLLGSQVYTWTIHTNMSISIPQEVIDPLAAGLKYIWPIRLSSKKVRLSWEQLKLKAMSQWTFCTTLMPSYKYDYDISGLFEIINHNPQLLLDERPSVEEAKKIYTLERMSSDEFFRLPVPFVEKLVPREVPEVPWIAEAFDLGWGENDCVLSSMPTVNKDGHPRVINLNEAQHWLESNKILVKPTDKNLGTALVTLDWYDDAICSFIRNNRGYQIIDHALAQVHLIRQVRQIIGVANTDIAQDLPRLRSYLVSRLPGLRRDEGTGWRVEEPNADWISDLTIMIPLFNRSPKIHKTPWAIRPIVPCHSVVQQPASQMLSVILKTFLPAFPWILVSSKHLCRDIEGIVNPKLHLLTKPSWNRKVFICTTNISGFYTNVDIQDCSVRLRTLVEETYANTDRGDEKVRLITNLFHAQQDTLIFRVKTLHNNWLIVQRDSLAMGMDAAPDIANLYAATYEHKLFENEPILMDSLLLYR